jgi:multiple antibiotic resistance protein
MGNYIHSIIGILAVINPMVCGAMLLNMEGKSQKKDMINDGIKAMLAVMAILLISVVLGKSILNAFGISMDAFKAVGGIILSMIGFNMLLGSKNGADQEKSQQGLTPLIFFAASPGTISMVITLAAAQSQEGLPIPTIVGIIVAVLITMLVMIILIFTSSKKKSKGRGILSQFMGLIIVSMGLQFTLDGLKHFFGL